MVHKFAASGIQLCSHSDRPQPPSVMGPQASGRSRLEVRMSAFSATLNEGNLEWRLPSRGRVGMWCLIAAEAAIFTIFVVAYIFYIGKSITGPQPKDVLHPPIFYTVCLLASSLTIHIALRRITAGKMWAFARWWLLTILLGGIFLFGTAREWNQLIFR